MKLYHLRNLICAALVVVPQLAAGVAFGEPVEAIEEEIDKTETPEPTMSCQSFVPPEELEDAQRVALRGVACFEEEKYIQALRHYRRAFEVSESPLLMGAIGRVFQEMGYPALAREYYNSYLMAESDPDGKEKIAVRLADVDKELAEDAVPTRIETNPTGARVYFVMGDDHWELAGESPVELELLPGEYDLVIRKDGFTPAEESLVVRERTSPENISGPVKEYTLADPQALFDTSDKEWRERGVAVTIASIPFIAAGATMIALGLGKEADSVELQDAGARDAMNQDASRLKTWGGASLAVGATGIVVGAVLYLVGLDDSEPVEGEPRASLGPTFDAQSMVIRF